MPRKPKEPGPPPPNIKFIEWLTEWCSQANENNNKNLFFCYRKALTNLKQVEKPLHVSELIKVTGIGASLERKFKDKVEIFLKSNPEEALYLPGTEKPQPPQQPEFSPPAAKKKKVKDKETNGNEVVKEKTVKKREYRPQYRTGAFGILIALLEFYESGITQVTKSQLISAAQLHCDTSYSEATGHSVHHTAWSSMGLLIQKDLVEKQGNPSKYSLTVEGMTLAETLNEKRKEFEAGVLTSSQPFSQPLSQPLSQSQHEIFKPMKTSRKVENTKEIPFQFLFVSADQKAVKSKSLACMELDDSFNYGFQIVFHEQQQQHDFVKKLADIKPFQNKPGLLCGFLKEEDAPEESPGIDLNLFHSQNLPPVFKQPSVTPFKVPFLESRPIHETPEEKRKSFQKLPLTPSQYKIWPSPMPKSVSLPEQIQPITFKAGTYEIILVVDIRERKTQTDRDYIQNYFQRLGIETQLRSIELGDFCWIAKPYDQSRYDEVILDFLIERKRLDDLVSSIQFGRYNEQKFRLRQSGIGNLFYLVEEFESHSVVDFGRDRLRTAMVETNIHHQIKIIRTNGLNETLQHLSMIHEIVLNYYKDKDLLVLPEQLLDARNHLQLKKEMEKKMHHEFHYSFGSFTELNSKTKTMTLKDTWFKQLMCIRGLSVDKVYPFVEKYPTMQHFLRDLYSRKGLTEQIALFQDLRQTVGRKNIGDALKKRIIQTFTATEVEE